MNRQEVFDKVSKHLLTQNKQAYTDLNGCLYRTEDGLKCAIGCLISDKDYTPDIENIAVSNLAGLSERLIDNYTSSPHVRSRELLFRNILKKTLDIDNEEDFKFLSELQDIHDRSEPEDWKQQLNLFAEDYKLNTFYIDNQSN